MAQDLAQAYVQIIPTAKGIGKDLEDLLGDGSEQAGKSSGTKIAAGIISAFGAIKLGSKITSFVQDSIEAGKDFDKAMAQVAATMGKNVNEIDDLREFAKEMGSSTAFSATQAAEALNYMALAGYDAEQSMQALPNVLNLAAAGGIDLAYASDMVTDAQSALGLSFEESEDLVNKMAITASKSNTSVAQLGEAILTVGGTAKNLKGGTTELATVLGILADNGIKGAEGGTALRNVILSLSAPTDKAAELMEQLGLNAFDADGNMRPLEDTFGDLNSILGTMSQKERTEVLNTLFNKVDLKSVNALLGTSSERFSELSQAIDGAWYTTDSLNTALSASGTSLTDMKDRLSTFGIDSAEFDAALATSEGNADLFAQKLHEAADDGVSLNDICGAMGITLGDLQGAFDNTAGAAQKMAETQLDSLAGDLTIMDSALEGMKIEVFDQMKDPLREAAGFATDMVTQLTTDLSESNIIENFFTWVEEQIPGVKRTIGDFGTALGEFASPLIELGGWLLEHPAVIEGALIGIVTAITVHDIITNVGSLASGFGTLLTNLTNPAWLATFGASAAIGAVVGIVAGVKAQNARDRAEELATHFGSIQLSLKDLKAAADAIVDNGTLGNLDEALANFTSSESALSTMQSAVSELNKANWKISIGMELTEQEASAYQTQIETYVGACQQYIDDQSYGVHLTLSLLSESLDPEESYEDALASNAVSKIEGFYQGKQQELADLGKQLNEYVTTAFNDGLLDIDEVAEIQRLQQQMADIQAALAGSSLGATFERIGMDFSGTELTVTSFKNLQAEITEAANDAAEAYGEAFEHGVAALNITYNSGETDMTQEQYDAALKALKEDYLNNLAEIQLQAQEFSLNTIMDAYGEQISEAAPEFIASLQQELNDFFDDEGIWSPDESYHFLTEALDNVDSGLSSTVKANIEELLDGMLTTEALENIVAKAEDLGVSVPESVSTGLKDAAVLQAMTGDVDAMLVLVADELAESEDMANVLATAIDGAMDVPETFRKTIEEHADDVKPAIDGMYQTTAEYLEEVFSKGFHVSTTVSWEAIANDMPEYKIIDHTRRAAGGIVTKPELSWIAEAGYPESVIPWDGSRHAFDLWMQTGEGIGAFEMLMANRQLAEAAYSGSSHVSGGYAENEVMRTVEMIRDSVESLSRNIMQMQVVLDSGAVVGELADPLDQTLGQRKTYYSRRN